MSLSQFIKGKDTGRQIRRLSTYMRTMGFDEIGLPESMQKQMIALATEYELSDKRFFYVGIMYDFGLHIIETFQNKRYLDEISVSEQNTILY